MPNARTDEVRFAFAGGEVAEKFAARADVAKLAISCRTLVNMKVGNFGQADRRKGFRFVAYTKESEPA